jgi:hypothetical protein
MFIKRNKKKKIKMALYVVFFNDSFPVFPTHFPVAHSFPVSLLISSFAHIV